MKSVQIWSKIYIKFDHELKTTRDDMIFLHRAVLNPYKKVHGYLGISPEQLRFPVNLIPRILEKNVAFFRVNLHNIFTGIPKISREPAEVERSFKFNVNSREFARTKFSKVGSERNCTISRKFTRVLANSGDFLGVYKNS